VNKDYYFNVKQTEANSGKRYLSASCRRFDSYVIE